MGASEGRPERFFAVESARYPDGVRVELEAGTAREQVGEDAVCVVTFDDSHRVVGLQVLAHYVPKAPPIWFAELRQSAARPPAVNLLAFTGHDQPAGTLVEESDLSNLPVRSSDQLAALRWYPASGEVDQIYVQPAWRRRGLASAMIAAGATLSVARDWPRLWGDGQRTQLGEELRNASSWRHRAADLTHVVPPMTPGDA